MLRLPVIVFLLFYFPVVLAEETRLSVSSYLGLHKPALEDLNQHEFKAPIAGLADLIVGTGDNITTDVFFLNPLPEFSPGVTAGLEFLWRLNDRYDFIIGGGTWEVSSRALKAGDFFLQGQPAEVVNERTAKISYNEFYFGLRYNLIRSPKKLKGYYRLTLNEVFDIDYREDLIFLFTSGDAEGVKKSMILQSQATGLLMIQPGFGADYYFNDTISVGLEASYLIGLKRVSLRDGRDDVDFLPTDNLSLWLPQRVSPETGDLQYLSPHPVDNNDYTDIRLSFDGWKVLFKMNLHF